MIILRAMNKPSIISQTDLCVMCGMCLPHCPTYQLYQTETESPRGRIALIQSIENKQIEPTQKALKHIDHCLNCLNCETICPSKVPYGKLIDQFRQQHQKRISRSFISKQILTRCAKPSGLETFHSVAGLPIIKQLLKLSAPLAGISSSLLSAPAIKLKTFYPASIQSRGSVSFFTGCSGKHLDASTLNDAAQILNQLGFDVLIPDEQNCCGALHQHNGLQEVAQSLMTKNQAQLQQEDSLAILFFSPACGASLQQLKQIPVRDIRSFIDEQLQLHPLKFHPCDSSVALHESCSHRNMQKIKQLNHQLLSHIPDIHVTESAQPALCCGAGGLQTLNYPQQASSLLNTKLASFDLTQTNILLSDNIGCSLHIKSAITAYNPDIEVLHPVSLLARQLISSV